MSHDFKRILLQRAARLFDIATVCLTFLAALAISSGSFTWMSFGEVLAMRIKLFNLLFFAGYILACAAIFASCGFYLSHRLSRIPRRIREIFIAVTLITGVLAGSKWLLEFQFATALFLSVFWLQTVTVLMLAHITVHRVLCYARSQGKNLRSIVVVGHGLDAKALAHRIEQEPALGYRVVRIIDAKEI